jgi:hypothetical protein
LLAASASICKHIKTKPQPGTPIIPLLFTALFRSPLSGLEKDNHKQQILGKIASSRCADTSPSFWLFLPLAQPLLRFPSPEYNFAMMQASPNTQLSLWSLVMMTPPQMVVEAEMEMAVEVVAEIKMEMMS